MVRRVIFAYLILVTVLYEKCVKTELQGKIIGGYDTTIEMHPYMLSLRRLGHHWCAATLLSPKIAVTAAHCLEVWELPMYAVSAGNSQYNSDKNLKYLKSICRHPKYDSQNHDYDVAVLELFEPYNLTSKIRSVGLIPAGPDLIEGDLAEVVGWGTTIQGLNAPPRTLQAAFVPYVSRAKCNDSYNDDPNSSFFITDRMICFGYEQGGIDACQGDSGGPILYNEIQVGIVSTGRGCADSRYPGVYTNLANVEIRSYISACIDLMEKDLFSGIIFPNVKVPIENFF